MSVSWTAGRATDRRDPARFGAWGKWAIEVKTGRFQMSDLAGLLEFTHRYPGLRPLVVCSADGRAAAERAEVAAITWQEFLLDGVAGVSDSGML